MKGSPIIATAITILILLGMYMGMRALILPETPKAATASHGHEHKDTSSSEGHNDTALETEFELSFSSLPKSVIITQPSTAAEVLNITEFDSAVWNGSGILNLDGHHVELQVDIVWQDSGLLNFVEIVVSPERHASRAATLHSEDDISDIAELVW